MPATNVDVSDQRRAAASRPGSACAAHHRPRPRGSRRHRSARTRSRASSRPRRTRRSASARTCRRRRSDSRSMPPYWPQKNEPAGCERRRHRPQRGGQIRARHVRADSSSRRRRRTTPRLEREEVGRLRVRGPSRGRPRPWPVTRRCRPHRDRHPRRTCRDVPSRADLEQPRRAGRLEPGEEREPFVVLPRLDGMPLAHVDLPRRTLAATARAPIRTSRSPAQSPPSRPSGSRRNHR